ncbi:MAG: NusG domain II-containing protein [Selenomonadaceae bacterium]|nr:NusG domain II-containing protein [Selenomonadaceae bacterium]
MRKDILLILSLITLSLAPILFLSDSKGNIAEITVDGKIYKTLNLDKNAELTIKNEYGENKIVVENKKIFVETANCKDGVCVKTGAISKSGEIIACLPHRLLIEIKENE